MRKYISIFMLFVLVLACYAADTTNLTTTVVSSRNDDYVTYRVNLVHTGAATDNVFSKAIDLWGLEIESVQLLAFGVTRDVNIFFQGSGELEDTTFVDSPFTRTTALNGDLDDISPDAANTDLIVLPNYIIPIDSNGVETATQVVSVITVNDPVFKSRYFRIKSDGQAGNLVSTSTVAIINCRKIPGATRRDDYAAQTTL